MDIESLLSEFGLYKKPNTDKKFKFTTEVAWYCNHEITTKVGTFTLDPETENIEGTKDGIKEMIAAIKEIKQSSEPVSISNTDDTKPDWQNTLEKYKLIPYQAERIKSIKMMMQHKDTKIEVGIV